MSKFVVMIHGVNFLIREDESAEPKLMGFYVNVFLESENCDDAETAAVELVRTSPKLRAVVANPGEDSPRMFVTEIAELTDWPLDCSRPLSGFVYYDDPDAEWRKDYEDSSSSASTPA